MIDDIFIRVRRDGTLYSRETLWTPNGGPMLRAGFKFDEVERWTSSDPASVAKFAKELAATRHCRFRITEEAVAVVDAARPTFREELRDVPVRATTSEIEIAAKAEAKAAAKAAREAEKAAAIAETRRKTMLHLVGSTPEQIQAAYEALTYLRAFDEDRARIINREGFSKPDSFAGHRIDDKPGYLLTELDDATALKLARRYRKQLPAKIACRIGKLVA